MTCFRCLPGLRLQPVAAGLRPGCSMYYSMGFAPVPRSGDMTVRLDHMIVHARDKHEAATFLTEILGLPPPVAMGKFLAVVIEHGLSLDFADAPGEIRPQHYAFAVSNPELDAVLARIQARSIPYWADPQRSRPNEIGQRGASRAIYFADPSGHWLEVLT